MTYDFDKDFIRDNTLSFKWDARDINFPDNPNVIPLWLADMDFPCPNPIKEAVQKRSLHPAYGYSYAPENCKKLIAAWEKRRNNWDVDHSWVTFSGGVVPAINAAVCSFADEGEGVIVQTPVYYPFLEAVKNNHRVLCENRLIFNGTRWEINFEEFERLAKKPENKLFIMCNPHNPVSRVFEKDELERIAEICAKNNVIIFSDEIHSDLVYRHAKHIPIASINKEAAGITITATAPSKTFNTAGLQLSAVIASNKELRDKFLEYMTRTGYIVNLFGATAFEAAYKDFQCEDYLEQLIDYLWDNYLFMEKYLNENMPKIKCQRPEGTYLIWLDCRELGMNGKELEDFFIKEAGVAFDSGMWFGADCSEYMRINIACQRKLLEKALGQMKEAYDKKKF